VERKRPAHAFQKNHHRRIRSLTKLTGPIYPTLKPLGRFLWFVLPSPLRFLSVILEKRRVKYIYLESRKTNTTVIHKLSSPTISGNLPSVSPVKQGEGSTSDIVPLPRRRGVIGLFKSLDFPCRSSRAGLSGSDSTGFLICKCLLSALPVGLRGFSFGKRRHDLLLKNLNLRSSHGHGKGHGLT